jgi:hypothetical protein
VPPHIVSGVSYSTSKCVVTAPTGIKSPSSSTMGLTPAAILVYLAVILALL